MGINVCDCHTCFQQVHNDRRGEGNIIWDYYSCLHSVYNDKERKNYISSKTHNTLAAADLFSIIGSFSTFCLCKGRHLFCHYEPSFSLRHYEEPLLFCHCEKCSDEAISSNSAHSIFYGSICYMVYFLAGNRVCDCHSLLTQ